LRFREPESVGDVEALDQEGFHLGEPSRRVASLCVLTDEHVGYVDDAAGVAHPTAGQLGSCKDKPGLGRLPEGNKLRQRTHGNWWHHWPNRKAGPRSPVGAAASFWIDL